MGLFQRWLALGVVLSACGGCVLQARHSRHARLPDAPEPEDIQGSVDFTPLFARPDTSNTVYTERPDPGLMKSVLVSPNVVFESSRSSLGGPTANGPQNSPADAPSLPNALGKGIPIDLSSLLLRALADRGSALVPPVSGTLWDFDRSCAGHECSPLTWVERALLAYQNRAAQRSTRSFAMARPKAILAVRTLGLTSRELQAVVQPVDGQENNWVVKPRTADEYESACPNLTVSLPALSFEAEVIRADNGRLLARFHETRTPAPKSWLIRTAVVSSWVPFTETGHALSTTEGSVADNADERIAVWDPRLDVCDCVRRGLEDLKNAGVRAAQVAAVARSVIAQALDPLYGSGRDGSARGE